jgi:hypothetical protein
MLVVIGSGFGGSILLDDPRAVLGIASCSSSAGDIRGLRSVSRRRRLRAF